jgi:DNA helicase II / ATP-dependent DNA helicase PcrA
VALTEAQSIIVYEADGNFLVRACPGSGKTFTIAAKAVEDINHWDRQRSGIALLSFTNTAQTELQDEIEKVIYKKIVYPHYIGTIDSFINKYIFFPYINLLGFDTALIKMVGEPYTRNYGHSRKQVCALKFKYNLDGSYISPSGGSNNIYDKTTISDAKKVKYAMINGGYFTQADANYFALRILREHEYIRDVVSSRFPYIYIDEAQDTTPIHWEILKLVSSRSSNERFGVIGDPDQSIYGWNGAEPGIFIEYQLQLAKENRVFLLNDCRRSSQVICDFYFKFSTLERAPISIDPDIKDLGISPQFVYYDSLDEIGDTVKQFRSQHTNEDILMVSRSMEIVDRATRLDSVNPEAIGENPFSGKSYKASLALDILHAKSDYDSHRYADALYRAEAVYFTMMKIYNRDVFLDECGLSLRSWYSVIEADLQEMPDTDLSVMDWVTAVESTNNSMVLFQDTSFNVKKRGKINYKATRCADFFKDAGAINVACDVVTVHSAKGKTTDHTLVILDEAQAARVSNAFNGKPVLDSEEKRILYVAISRARKTLTLCLPRSFEATLVGKIY